MTANGCAIWLYGSHARGDRDTLSDVDILAVSDGLCEFYEVRSEINEPFRNVGVSHYSWQEIEDMATLGSLFLHHVRLEGRPIYESVTCKDRLGSMLQSLGGYQNVMRDVNGFKTVLSDVREEIKGDPIYWYELAVLATVIRHCSILGCWLLGAPAFGRVRPVERVAEALDLGEGLGRDFPELYRYRLYFEGRVGANLPAGKHCAREWLGRAESLVDAIEELAHGQQCGSVPEADRTSQRGRSRGGERIRGAF